MRWPPRSSGRDETASPGSCAAPTRRKPSPQSRGSRCGAPQDDSPQRELWVCLPKRTQAPEGRQIPEPRSPMAIRSPGNRTKRGILPQRPRGAEEKKTTTRASAVTRAGGTRTRTRTRTRTKQPSVQPSCPSRSSCRSPIPPILQSPSLLRTARCTERASRHSPSWKGFGAAMSSSPWEWLWNGDEDVATPLPAGAVSRCACASTAGLGTL